MGQNLLRALWQAALAGRKRWLMCFMCSGKQSRNGNLTAAASCSAPSLLSPSAAAGQLSPPDLLNLKAKTRGCVSVNVKLIHFSGLFPGGTCSSSLPPQAEQGTRAEWLYSKKLGFVCVFGAFCPTRKHQINCTETWKALNQIVCFKLDCLYIKLRANRCRKVAPKLTWNSLHLKPWQ